MTQLRLPWAEETANPSPSREGFSAPGAWVATPPPVERGGRVVVRGTNLSWGTLAEWIALAETEGDRVIASRRHYRRVEALYHSLRVEDLWRCTDPAVLRRVSRFFEGRNGVFHGPERCIVPIGLGEWRMAVHNRLVALERGDRRRPKGPRLDPTRLPDQALDRLIQQHRDLAVVNLLREERRRRLAGTI